MDAIAADQNHGFQPSGGAFGLSDDEGDDDAMDKLMD